MSIATGGIEIEKTSKSSPIKEAEISDEDALRQIQNLEKQIQNVKK